MMRRTIVGIACGVVLASIVLAPADVFAEHRRVGRDEWQGSHHLRTTLPPHVPRPHHVVPQVIPLFRAPIIIGVVPVLPLYPPPVYRRPSSYYDSSIYLGSRRYYDMSVYAPPPPAYGPPVLLPPPPPPMPSVIEYPEGRYELRGDGITTPYRWVWIPNPPPGPPPSAPPPAEPPATPPSSAPPPAPEPARHSTLYRWTDEEGAVHWTDRLDAVPERYRSKVTKSPS